jgi:hypothetical protein
MLAELAADLEAMSALAKALGGLLLELGYIGLALMGFCAWLASKWKQPEASAATRPLYELVNWLGQNTGEAQNLNDDRRTARNGDRRNNTSF